VKKWIFALVILALLYGGSYLIYRTIKLDEHGLEKLAIGRLDGEGLEVKKLEPFVGEESFLARAGAGEPCFVTDESDFSVYLFYPLLWAEYEWLGNPTYVYR